MTLRQSNGQTSSCVSTIAWPASTVGASSSSSPTVIASVTCVELQNNAGSASKAAKKHSLLDQKRRQWAEERAEQEEWYPFGRPGHGAPLKGSSERLSQLLRRQNNTAPSGSCFSDAGASNGSTTDYGGLNTTLPTYCQINAENHCTNGHLPQQQPPLPQPETTTVLTNYGYASNGFYASYPGVVAPYSAPIVSDSPCQTCPIVGATLANLPTPPASGPHIHYPQAPLPGAVNVSIGESGGHPDPGKHFAVVAPYYPNQHLCGYAAQGMTPVANGMQDPSQGYHVLAPMAPAPVIFTDPSVVSAGRNSLTQFRRNYYIASTGSPPYPPQASSAPPNQPERTGMPQPANCSGPTSYTEQWANQLPLWQDNEPHSPVHQRPNNLPLGRHPDSNGAAAAAPAIMHSPQQHPLQSLAGSQPRHVVGNTSTPVGYCQHPMAMAWVTPIQAKPDGLQRFAMVQQRTAIVSPMHSRPPSLSGNETLDGSTNLQFMSASFTGSVPGIGDESGIHRRRANVTAESKGEHDLEEKQIKMLEHKMALEEQLVEKRRKQLIDEERERREAERADRERRLIEQRETMENEQERNRWRKLADQEEKREELIMGPLQRAQEEARRTRHEKLLRHASCGRQSESDGYESMSPPAAIRSTENVRDQQPAPARTQEAASSTSSGPSVVGVPRSQSLPPAAASVPVMESPGDDRPIRPLTKDPLKIWEELSYSAEDDLKIQAKTNTPVRQSLRKSRSTEATKLETVRRSESLERKRKMLQATEEVSNGPANSTVQNGKKTKPKLKSAEPKEPLLPRNGSFHERLKSAGLISNATFIIESKENVDNGKHDTKIKDGEKGRKTKKKSTSDVNGSVEAISATVSEPAAKPKLLERRPSAGKPVLVPAANDNPWGNMLGGLNPLLQPIVTRRRKPRTSMLTPTTTDEPERRPCDGSSTAATSKLLNGNVRVRADSMLDLSQRTSESDTNNNENKTGVNGTSAAGTESKPVATRAPSLDRFNARSPLYGSISAKIKRPTEYQNRLMEQLSLLRQQLKKKQKEVEDGLSSTSQDSATIRDSVGR